MGRKCRVFDLGKVGKNLVPSVGKIVHYVSYGTPGGEFLSECMGALVTDVSNSGTNRQEIGLAVFYPNGLSFKERVPYNDGVSKGGAWHWPLRVE